MENTMKRNLLLERDFLRALIAIALPIAAQNMISFGIAAMDSIMLGSLGDVAISAASLGSQPFTILTSFGFGLSSGGSVLIAQYWGKKDYIRIRKVMRISMQLVLAASLTITLLCMCFPHEIMRIFTKDEAIIKAGAAYLSLAALSYIPYSISNNYMMSMRAVEKVKMSAAIYAASFFINVIFNYMFIFGKFGAPRMGIRGAAVGTILARCSELALVMVYMYTREQAIRFRFRDCLQFDAELLPSYSRCSLPVLGNELIWGIGFSITSVIIGRIGSVFVAANSISGVLNQLMFVSIAGIANGAAVLTGKIIGEGDEPKAQRAANTLLLFGAFVGIFNCAVVFLIRPAFLSLYQVTPETYRAAYQILGVQGLMQLILGVDITGVVGILRGGGDTKTSFLYDCGMLWTVSIPMGILSGLVFHWPVPLVFFCLRMDSIFKVMLSLRRIHSGKWIRNVTISSQKSAQTV